MTVSYSLTDSQVDDLERIMHYSDFELDERLDALAEFVERVAEENDVDAKRRLAVEIGTHNVVGTGMDCMTLDQVLAHLAEFAEHDDEFEIPQFGGNEALLDDISGNSRFDHSAYYALQRLYGRAIYEQMDTPCLAQRD